MNTQAEHDFEPVPGLPAQLPKGERMLWQGAPSWRSLARRAFLIRAIGVWFGLIASWRLAEGLTGRMSATDTVISIGFQAGLAITAIALLCAFAYAIQKTTIYTITDRRLVMRFGLAFDLAINLPFRQIESVGLRTFDDGSGNLPLKPAKGNHLAYFHLWPHARPWAIRNPQPMLRSVPDAARVARILADAMTTEALARGAEPAAAGKPARRPSGAPTLHAAE